MTNTLTKESQVSRREFCNSLLFTTTGMLIAATVHTSEAGASQERSLAYPSLKIEGAERLMPGSSLQFTYPTASDPAILVRARDGQFYAYVQKCPHSGCSVHFDSANSRLECPCHKGAFDAQSGMVLYGPPTRPLNLIVLQIRSGNEVWAVGQGNHTNRDPPL